MDSKGLRVDGIPIDEVIESDLSILASFDENHPHKAGTLDHLGRMYYTRYQHRSDHSLSDISNSIQYSKNAVALLSTNDTGKNRILHAIGIRSYSKFQQTGDRSDIDDAIKMAHEAVLCTPEVDVAPKLQMLQALADHYASREGRFGDTNDSYSAIGYYQQVVRQVYLQFSGLDRLWKNIASQFEAFLNHSAADYDEDFIVKAAEEILIAMSRLGQSSDTHQMYQQVVRSGLAKALLERSERNKSLIDLERSISILADLTSRADLIPRYRSPLGNNLKYAYRRLDSYGFGLKDTFLETHDPTSLDEALSLSTRSYEYFKSISNEEGLAAAAHHLGSALYARHKHFDDQKSLDDALKFAKLAIRKTPAVHVWRQTRVTNLGRYLAKQYRQVQSGESIQSKRDEIELLLQTTDLAKSKMEYEEAQILVKFYKKCDSSQALDAAIELLKDVVSSETTNRKVFVELANTARRRWRLRGRSEDLELAFSSAETAFVLGSIREIGEDEKSQIFSIFSTMRGERYLTLGNMDDLQESIRLAEEAIRIAPADNLSSLYMQLGNHLRWRFEALGAGEDITEAVRLCEKALRISPARQLMKRNNYGEVLYQAYRHTQDIKYLDRAIEQGAFIHAAWSGTRPKADNIHWLSNYGIRLDQRAIRRQNDGDNAGAISDAQLSIELTKEAYDLTVKLSSNHLQAAMTNNLALRYYRMARLEPGITEHRNLSVEFSRKSIGLTSRDHPAFCRRSRVLAECLERLKIESAEEEIVSTYWEAFSSEAAPVKERLFIVPPLSAYLIKTKDIGRLDWLLWRALQLIPQLQIQALRRSNQQQRVQLISQLVGLAAAVAVEARSEPLEALNRLEKGRMIIFNSLADQRQEALSLKAQRPDLHDNLVRLEKTLESNTYEDDSENTDMVEAARYAGRRLDAAHQLDHLIKEIQRTPGLQAFREPPSSEEYQTAACSGPIVVLNATQLRCDALIVRKSGVSSLSLHELGVIDLKKHAEEMQAALSNAARSSGVRRRYALGQANNTLRKTFKWLWKVVVQPVLAHLGYLRTSPSQILPHIWWVCCDTFSLFPLHAAGDHSTDNAENTMKYCISSYTPTVKALMFARKQHQSPGPHTREPENHALLAIPMPITPGRYVGQFSNLNTDSEIASIRRYAPPSWQPIITLTDPTRESVLTHISSCQIVHFACHALSHPLNPSASQLVLADHQTSPLTVLRLSTLKLKSSRLAFLSACHSAVNLVQNLAEEGITIASAFQLAGFPSVVGTLWQAMDVAAVDITRRFYKILFAAEEVSEGEGGITGEMCARVLHEAVEGMKRERRVSLIEWASWVHIGD